MIKLITLNDDGTVAYEQEKPKRYRPRNGFYRMPNGDFVKQLGDPRNITDIEIAQAIKKKMEEDERERLRKEEEARNPKPPPLPPQERPQNNYPLSIYTNGGERVITQVLMCFRKFSYKDWMDTVRWNASMVLSRGHAFERCSLRMKISLDQIDDVEVWHRIELIRNEGVVHLWLKHNRSKDPDFIVNNAFMIPTEESE